MKLTDLKYEYPEELIATSPVRPSRIMWVPSEGAPEEISVAELLRSISAGDVLVINNTKVLKRRVFSENEIEVLFLDKMTQNEFSNTWKVLFL